VLYTACAGVLPKYFSSRYCERAICSTRQSRRMRSPFHASRVSPRLGNHGAGYPMPEQMIQKQNSNWLLPAALSTTAGATDVISFLALGGLFTAHITGNLVILAAHNIKDKFGQIGPLLSLPMFVGAWSRNVRIHFCEMSVFERLRKVA
jgi:hypothetical protein